MGEQIEALTELYRTLGAKDSFRKIAFFNLEQAPAQESTKNSERVLFKQMKEKIAQLPLESLLDYRLHIFANHQKRWEEIFNDYGIPPQLRAQFPEKKALIFYQALLNITDFALFQRMTKDRSHQDFHIVKEYLYNCEDYRDQIEHFMDFRIPYQHDVSINDPLQDNLANEFKLISEFTHQLFQLYEAAMEHIERRQQA